MKLCGADGPLFRAAAGSSSVSWSLCVRVGCVSKSSATDEEGSVVSDLTR